MSENLPKYLHVSHHLTDDISAAITALNPDKIAVLVDENTETHCLPFLELKFDLRIRIQSGESFKTLNTCQEIWEQLTQHGFTRKDVLINLGGGVICDMGGFAAATYKRGMPFINVPTTLLSQVDASIGGKLGVDFHGLKNHIGCFKFPDHVFVTPSFLNTLPAREMMSGFAEIIKHALISSERQWEQLLAANIHDMNWATLIPSSISIKHEVVQQDPTEQGLRKILNYGHTLGHAIESHFLSSTTPLLHGEAIAKGMQMENMLAVRLGILDASMGEQINQYIEKHFPWQLPMPSFEALIGHLQQDKKNDREGIRFSLLDKVGSCTHDVLVEPSILKEMLK